MTSIFKKILRIKENGDMITVVSGLPRSGTSMMMQMLEAGGMPVATDNIRKADDDNPRGYYEFEKVKKIKEDSSWLKDCQGKAFKMVSELLYHLPEDRRYKVIFITREIKEMLSSQRVMLQRSGQISSKVSDEEMAGKFEKRLRNVESWLAGQPNIDVLHVKYNDIIQEPLRYSRSVNRFLGGYLNEERMAQIVKESLYRQRRQPTVQDKDYSEDEEEEVKKRLEDLGYL